MRRLLAIVALLGACHPAGPGAPPVTDPIPRPEDPASGRPDVHSFSRPQEVRATRIGLALDVRFDERTLAGTATIAVARHDEQAPLVLDTRDLAIQEVEAAALDARARDAPLAEAELAWRSTPWALGPVEPHLGRPLVIRLPPGADVVRVRYRSDPNASGLQWLEPGQTADGQEPFLYSQSQAIHARSWLPCQDSPGVRTSHDAVIHAPAPLRALMAADPDPSRTNAAAGRFAFTMAEPVPAYLIALAVGRVEFAELGPRTGVWAEPSVVANAAYEFSDVERMVRHVEQLYGPYRWGRYDVLVLPPAFPFGGMENPKLTFATPTIIAGDRSLVALIAHELAHSWSGNLVTNATWGDLWLNEGFTVYIERRILESLYGRDRADMEAVLGRQDLDDALAEMAPEDTRLRLELAGRDPDDGLSDVAYEKGALLLTALEHVYGRERFDPFLQSWFSTHAFGSVSTVQFEAFLKEHLTSRFEPLSGQQPVDLAAWLDQPGVPADAPKTRAVAFGRVDAAAGRFADGTERVHSLPTATWTPHEWLRFLRVLPKDIARERLAELDDQFHLTSSDNQEILAQWLEVAVLRGYTAVEPRLEKFLRTVGRRKFVLPLYRALLARGRREDARRIYAISRAGYHPITQHSLDAILGVG